MYGEFGRVSTLERLFTMKGPKKRKVSSIQRIYLSNVFILLHSLLPFFKYSITSLCGHLSKVDTSSLWTPPGPFKLFLLEMNLLNVDTSVFWTVNTFFDPFIVNNLSKVDTRPNSPYIFHSIKFV